MQPQRPRLLCLFETAWDRRQLGQCRDTWEGRLELVFPEPSDADCAARVRPASEVRPANESYNQRTGGIQPNSNRWYSRVTGNFTGTTD